MAKEELIKILLDKPGYLKSGSKKVASIFNVTRTVAKEAIREAHTLRNTSSRKNIKRLFFDIETSPNVVLAWRAGYKLNISPESIVKERAIICICWKWEGDEQVQYLTWDDSQDDKEMLKIFVEVLHEADEAIGHNGDKYDIPWVRTRCLYHGIPVLPDIKSLDTLKKVRSRFILNSNKLDYIGQFLGVGKKQDTGGFDLWKNICLNNCKESLNKMVDYCKQDVILLEKVYNKIDNYIKHNTHVGVLTDDNAASCPGCGSINHREIKTVTSPAGAINYQLQCTDCNKYYKVNKTNLKKLKDAYL